MEKALLNIESVLNEIPILKWFWSIGIYTWIAFVLFVWSIYKRCDIMAFFPALALTGTRMIATLVYAEFRYAYPLIVTLPLFIVIGLSSA